MGNGRGVRSNTQISERRHGRESDEAAMRDYERRTGATRLRGKAIEG